MKTCVQWLPAATRYCEDPTTRLYVQGHYCESHAPKSQLEHLPVTGAPQRPAGHGIGLTGSACPERADLVQAPDGQNRFRMCVLCGRITARLDRDGLAWCGGQVLAVRDLVGAA